MSKFILEMIIPRKNRRPTKHEERDAKIAKASFAREERRETAEWLARAAATVALAAERRRAAAAAEAAAAAAAAAAEAARTRDIAERIARKSLGKLVGATGRLTRRHSAVARSAAARLATVRRNEAAAPAFFPPPRALTLKRWTELNNAPYPTAPKYGTAEARALAGRSRSRSANTRKS